MKNWLAGSAALVIYLLALAGALQGQTSADFKVIVHPDNPVTMLTRKQVSELFLKRTTKWVNGGVVLPADLAENSPVRKQFSEEIHGKSPSSISTYWQERVFAGRAVPPPQKRNDEAVVAFVQAFPGAVGYVSAGAPVGKAKVVEIRYTDRGAGPSDRF